MSDTPSDPRSPADRRVDSQPTPRRRDLLRTVGTTAAAATAAASAGCLGGLSDSGNTGPERSAGTLVVANESGGAREVRVDVTEGADDALFDETVDPGELAVREEFVTASAGTVVGLAARIDESDPVTFEFLPGGSEDGDSPPEVARLALEGATAAEATWTAEPGQ